MKKFAIFMIVFCLFGLLTFAQQNTPQKFALVIGNGNYTGLTKLNNPVNDANDVAVSLQKLGFTVDKLLNGSQDQIDSAVMRLKNRLSVSNDSYGFFFYAGHGVQSGGENYLIPVDANIPSENALRSRAVSVQMVLDDLNDAGNSLNVIVLDACRDNPFSWSRSGTRGLSIVSRQPTDSIIVYATSAGQRAADGEGRNGLFTSQLLKSLDDQSLEVMDVFRNTGMNVAEVSRNQQIPAIYSQVFKKAYLGTPPSAAPAGTAVAAAPSATAASAAPVQPLPSPPVKAERIKKEKAVKERPSDEATRLWTVGASIGSSFAAPWVIGTAHGTIAPLNYFFMEAGIDIGFVSGISGVDYTSFFPFAHAAFFMPFAAMSGNQSSKGGLYAGVGAGFMMVNLNYPEGSPSMQKVFAADLVAGANLLNMIDISYTFRTSFSNSTNKLSVGYVYRF